MKQLLQHLTNGQTEVAEVPCPQAGAGQLLIQSAVSLVSAGTERMLVDFGKANLINKARQQPDKVRQVFDKAKTEGVLTTLDAVRSKLDQPLAPGYCNVGTVLEVGSGAEDFRVGDRVVSNGRHAEIVAVPRHLCARIPEAVADEQASFTVLAAIGLQGIRLAQPTLGEAVVVSGLGLIGLLTVQLLRAQGCRVLGLDFDAARLALAEQFGAEVVNLSQADPLSAARIFSRGRGVDAVLITASTRSSEPVSQAAKMCRKRGRIVLVGVTGLELSRADFYDKELSFQVSCSYGPGRYDATYEEKGQDYPIAYVRWTEQRNFEAVLDMLAAGRLDVEPLISHRFDIDDAPDAYALLTSEKPSLGILLHYPARTEAAAQRVVSIAAPAVSHKRIDGISAQAKAVIGFIGAGNYASRVLIPAFSKSGALLHTLVTSGGVSAVHYGKKFGFWQASTDADALLNDAEINTVVIATRHDTHAQYVLKALQVGKHVFVEKPLCLTLDELDAIETQLTHNPGLRLMVGFNRRFALQIKKIKALLNGIAEPKNFIMTVNAGAIPAEHWAQDPAVGGGRILGEACHFIDLLRFLAGAPIVAQHIQFMAGSARDSAHITLQFADGSVGVVHYLANGHKAVPKERLEIFSAGRVLQLDNFRKLRGYGWPDFQRMNLWRQDKGQETCAAVFVEQVNNGGSAPIPLAELIEVSRASIELSQSQSMVSS